MNYVFYWGDKPQNFGDVLTRNILEYFNVSFTHTNKHDKANMFATGSIARLAGSGDTVIGSGVIRKGEKAHPDAIWKSVRGPLTRENVIRCGGQCPEIYGDPALMLPLFCAESEKKHKVGIVPHYQDYNKIKNNYGKDYKIINLVNENPISVAKEITSCERIISSSLHGIICAHAYGIPAARVSFTKLHGDGIKFKDYCASVNVSHDKSTIDNPKYTIGQLPDLQPLINIYKNL